MFNRNNSSDSAQFLTQEAAGTYVNGITEELTTLKGRVTALEGLASQRRANSPRLSDAVLPTRAPGGSVAGTYDSVTGSSRPSVPTTPVVADTTGVDYGAVAFGLSEIAAKVRGQLGATAELTAYYRETVQYFADVFSKSDPSFDEATFKRQSGV